MRTSARLSRITALTTSSPASSFPDGRFHCPVREPGVPAQPHQNPIAIGEHQKRIDREQDGGAHSPHASRPPPRPRDAQPKTSKPTTEPNRPPTAGPRFPRPDPVVQAAKGLRLSLTKEQRQALARHLQNELE
jgi:hypothetical protein